MANAKKRGDRTKPRKQQSDELTEAQAAEVTGGLTFAQFATATSVTVASPGDPCSPTDPCRTLIR